MRRAVQLGLMAAQKPVSTIANAMSLEAPATSPPGNDKAQSCELGFEDEVGAGERNRTLDLLITKDSQRKVNNIRQC